MFLTLTPTSTSTTNPWRPQRKVNGVKAVVTLSSSVAQMGRVSEAARALDTPLGLFDKFQFAYKVSKSALNQGARGTRCRGAHRQSYGGL